MKNILWKHYALGDLKHWRPLWRCEYSLSLDHNGFQSSEKRATRIDEALLKTLPENHPNARLKVWRAPRWNSLKRVKHFLVFNSRWVERDSNPWLLLLLVRPTSITKLLYYEAHSCHLWYRISFWKYSISTEALVRNLLAWDTPRKFLAGAASSNG